MRDEYPPQSPSAEERPATDGHTDAADESARNAAARADSAGRNADRWVPLVYDLEQNGEGAGEYRGEVY